MDEDLKATQSNVVSTQTPIVERISNEDKMVLDLANANRRLAVSAAELALSKNENAELAFRYTGLQIFMKYQLSVGVDSINENGEIIRGGALQQAQGK